MIGNSRPKIITGQNINYSSPKYILKLKKIYLFYEKLFQKEMELKIIDSFGGFRISHKQYELMKYRDDSYKVFHTCNLKYERFIENSIYKEPNYPLIKLMNIPDSIIK